MPDWVKVRADFRPMPQGFALLDQGSLSGDAEWSYPTLPSGCVTQADNPIRFRKDGQGWVHLCGGFTNSSGATITTTQDLFVLPVGYRPRGMSFALGAAASAARPHWYVYQSNAGTGHGRISIDLDGLVRLSVTALTNTSSLDCSGVSFYAEH